ncbi:MAG: substrate-binding domain-containing protein [Fulvivirga sp.]|uniref:substrate-binding domain-containing protein n=1 Tax=Fulvivirga sp. TaxID=1931237 RepID=UPI0032EF4536
MELTTLRIGGVPEHFNLPIHLAIESGAFSEKNIEIIWKDFPGGTGSMTQALRNDETDICILLTEGIITDIINGNASKIISGYVKSPLTWGIHTYVTNDEQLSETLFKEQIAISRKGSGSHLMPIVDALIQGKSIQDDQFVIIKDINGALDSLKKQETSVFYWEKYTTKPFVKNGHLKRIGEFISPWPCFMIAATDRIIQDQPEAIDTMLRVIHDSCEKFMTNPDAPKLVSERYNLDYRDAEYWYHGTEWTTDSWVSDKMLTNVVFALREAKIIPDNANTLDLVWKR